jgi:hypothetical protein
MFFFSERDFPKEVIKKNLLKNPALTKNKTPIFAPCGDLKRGRLYQGSL